MTTSSGAQCCCRIESEPAQDFTQALGKIDALAGSAQTVLANLENATGTLADEQVRLDIRRGVAALSSILVSLDSGPGYAAKLMHDEAEAERLSRVVANLEQVSSRLDQVLAGVDTVLDRVKSGPGLAHEVVYGESGSRALALVRLDRADEAERKGEPLTVAGAAVAIRRPAYMKPAALAGAR